MKTLMNKLFILFILFVSCISCTTTDDGYSLGDIWLSLGLVETDSTFGYDYIIYTDNGDTLFPAVSNVGNFETFDEQRVFVNYTVLDEVGSTENKLYVKINNLQEVLFKDVIQLTDENSDSLGNDLTTISDLWIVNNLLNIEFKYFGSSKIHYINLAYTLNENGELEEPVELEFRHNANNEHRGLILNNVVTFKLDKLRIEGQNSTDFTISNVNLHNREQSFTGTYSY